MSTHNTNIQGFDGSRYTVGIVTAQFNDHITDPMLDHCIKTLTTTFSVDQKNITSVRVPGAADAPAVLSAMARSNKYDAIIVMGAIIRGETAHFDYVSELVTYGVKDIQIQHAIPVAFGVLMCDTQQQAEDRIILGKEFAAAALHTLRVIEAIK